MGTLDFTLLSLSYIFLAKIINFTVYYIVSTCVN